MAGSTTEEPMPALTDAEFRAAYAISHTIGAGGGGEVYLATQSSLSRPVVVKVIQPQLVADPVHMARFQREARMLSSLNHVRITQLYEYGLWGKRPYLVMEYVDGGSLAMLMETQGALEPAEAVRIAMEIAEGLAYLHGRKMLHRDIKPGNILLTRAHEVKIADFGLARPDGESGLTGDGFVVGTLWYIAPELLVSEEASVKSDLFSLGMVTYQMLSARMAFREDITDVVKLASHRVNEPSLPLQHHAPHLPAELCAIVNRLIASDPAARPDSAKQVIAMLASVHDALVGPSRRLRRPGYDRPTEEHPSLPVIESPSAPGATTARAEFTPKETPTPADTGPRDGSAVAKRPKRDASRRTRGLWSKLSRRARALMVGFGLAGAAAGLAVGLRMRPAPPPSIHVEPGVEPVRPLTVERFPKWAHARMTSVTPGQLVLRVSPAGGAPGKTLEAESHDLHEHDVTVEPLDPRVNYEVQARLRLPSGQEHNLGSQIVLSPLVELLTLARDIERGKLLETLTAYDESRKLRQPPDAARVMDILNRFRWPAKLKALGEYAAAVYADPDLRESDLVELYRGFGPVRLIDRYAEAHGLKIATEIGKFMPPDLTSTRPPIPKGRSVATAKIQGNGLLVPEDVKSEFLVDIGDQLNNRAPLYHRASDTVVAELTLPAGLDKKPRAELAVTITNIRSTIFTVEVEGFPTPVMLVPPYAAAVSGESVRLIHSVPPHWLTAGRHGVIVRARVSPCTQNNFTNPIPVYSEVERNMPLVNAIEVVVP